MNQDISSFSHLTILSTGTTLRPLQEHETKSDASLFPLHKDTKPKVTRFLSFSEIFRNNPKVTRFCELKTN
jgi:hypothetical protein